MKTNSGFEVGILEHPRLDNTTAARQDIEGALKRYYATSYRGVNVWSNPTQTGRIEEERRLIVCYKFVDERKTRYLADKVRAAKKRVSRARTASSPRYRLTPTPHRVDHRKRREREPAAGSTSGRRRVEVSRLRRTGYWYPGGKVKAWLNANI